MSGFAVVVGGEPGLRDSIARQMTRGVAARGGHSAVRWEGDDAIVVFAALDDGSARGGNDGPLQIGPDVVVADGRIDDRGALIAALRERKVECHAGDSDAALILHAVATWGRDAPTHLVGDFAFVAWSHERHELLAAVDRFAMRQVYFATIDDIFVIANDLAALAEVPELHRAINERAIGDFLLFGQNDEPGTTFYERISCLPPAHRLIVCNGRAAVSRYWALAITSEPLRISKRDAVASFRAIFRTAVKERASCAAISVAMSGGLDSTAVAAMLADLNNRGEIAADVRAVTSVLRRDADDPEERYARAAAKALGMPIEVQVVDEFQPYARWREIALPEPVEQPRHFAGVDFARRVREHGPVMMMGHGGDPVLYASHDYFAGLLLDLRWLRFVREAGGYALRQGKLPPLLLRSRILRMGAAPPRFPRWVNPDFAARIDLPGRWQSRLARTPVHPFRDDAFRRITDSYWQQMFAALHSGVAGPPMYVMMPFFDVRLVEFTLQLPPMPYFGDKDLLREGMRGFLPEAIRRRPKTPLRPLRPGAETVLKARRDEIIAEVSALDRYVDRRILCTEVDAGERSLPRRMAAALGIWLAGREGNVTDHLT